MNRGRGGVWWWLATATTARTADEMAAPAIFLAVLAAHRDPTAAAVTVAALTLAAGLAGPVVGAKLDRADSPRRVTAAAMLWMGAVMIGFSAAGSLPLVVSVVLAAAVGIGAPVVSGGWTSQLPTVVPASLLPRATSWDAATYNVAGIMGPGLIGLVGVGVGQQFGIALAGAVMLAAVPPCLLVPRPAATDAGDTAAGEKSGTSVHAGLRLLLSNIDLRRVTVITTVGHMGVGVAFVAVPVRAMELVDASWGSVLLACFAAGALLGTVLCGYTRLEDHPDFCVLLGTLGLGVGFIVASTCSMLSAVGATLTVVGVLEGLMFTGLLRVRHREAPQSLRGQVSTTAASLKIGAYAVGVSTVTLVTEDGRLLFVIAGALHLAAAATAAVVAPRVRADRSPEVGHP